MAKYIELDVAKKAFQNSEAIAAPKLYKYCPNCGEKMRVQND